MKSFGNLQITEHYYLTLSLLPLEAPMVRILQLRQSWCKTKLWHGVNSSIFTKKTMEKIDLTFVCFEKLSLLFLVTQLYFCQVNDIFTNIMMEMASMRLCQKWCNENSL